MKIDNDYWSVPPPPPFSQLPDGLGQRNLGSNLIRPQKKTIKKSQNLPKLNIQFI